MAQPKRYEAYDRQAVLDLQAAERAATKARIEAHPLPPPPSTPQTRRMHRLGFTDEQISAGLIQQAAQYRDGQGLRPLHAILTGRGTANHGPLAELAPRQLSRRGRYGQAALLADQQALQEKDPQRRAVARDASNALKLLSGRPQQVEFDFFMANTSTGHQYLDAMLERLSTDETTAIERAQALATLTIIIRHLGWQTHVCDKSATELAGLLGVHKSTMSRTLNLLEQVGAIRRAKRGRTMVITITPEGAYRGDITRHTEAVDRYKAEVLIKFPTAPRKRKTEPQPAESA